MKAYTEVHLKDLDWRVFVTSIQITVFKDFKQANKPFNFSYFIFVILWNITLIKFSYDKIYCSNQK